LPEPPDFGGCQCTLSRCGYAIARVSTTMRFAGIPGSVTEPQTSHRYIHFQPVLFASRVGWALASGEKMTDVAGGGNRVSSRDVTDEAQGAADFVVFPDPQLVAEIAKVEAEPLTAEMKFSYARSIAFALLFALAGSALYAGVVYVANMELGLVSIVIGALAGLGAARGGRGRPAQIIGAIAAAVGYFAGILFAVAVQLGVSAFLSAPIEAHAALFVEIVKLTFSSMGVLFLGIAVYEGWIIPRGAVKS
jgi:hypothetical protein